MKKISMMLIVFAVVSSCKEKETTVETVAPVNDGALIVTPSIGNGCYTFEGNGSKINLNITNTENGISGNLDYKLAEKDKNSGTFQGTMKGDTLMVLYTYQSEGTESKREVAFLVKDNQLIEGYGELDATGTKFKMPAKLQFTSNMPLSKTDCK